MHLHDILGMKLSDYAGERRRIHDLLHEKYYVPTGMVGSRCTTYIYEAEKPFRRSNFRGTSVDINDLFCRCAPYWSSNDLESLLLYCEVVANIVLCVDSAGLSADTTKARGRQILENICIVLDKTGYEFHSNEQKIYFITQKNAIATDVVHELYDKHLALAILEYNRFSLKGEIDRKRELLNVIGQAVEPILKDTKAKARSPEVFDDVKFALNRLNIRHNNLSGANEQPTLKSLSKDELETAYDDLYSSMLVLLKISQLKEGHARMEALKKQMTKS